MRRILSSSVISGIDPDLNIVDQFLSDGNLFRHAFNFMFDRNPTQTFVCFGRMGGVMMGAAAYAGINSIIWIEDWTDLTTIVARVDPTAKTIIAITDVLSDDTPYYPQCWDKIAAAVHMTPSSVSEIRCIVDSRTSLDTGVTATSIEAVKLVNVSSVIRRNDIEKDAKTVR